MCRSTFVFTLRVILVCLQQQAKSGVCIQQNYLFSNSNSQTLSLASASFWNTTRPTTDVPNPPVHLPSSTNLSLSNLSPPNLLVQNFLLKVHLLLHFILVYQLPRPPNPIVPFSIAIDKQTTRQVRSRNRQADKTSSSKSQNCSTHATITPGKRHEGGAHLRKFLHNCHQTRESTELQDFCPQGRNYSDSAARATSIIYVPISGAKHSERPQQPLRGRSRRSSQSGKFFAIYDSTSLKSGRIDIINRFHKSTICTMPQWNTY